MFHYTYMITNKINSKIYIGVHSTENMDDGYMGSCIPLTKDIKKYGIKNFTKEIIEFHPTRKDALKRERELVNEEFVSRSDTYNINLGGSCGTPGLVPVRDKDGNTFAISKNDPRYISGDVVHVIKGKKYNFSESEIKRRSEHGKSNTRHRHVTNGIINKCVDVDELEEFLKNNQEWWHGQTQRWTEESILKNQSSEKRKINKELTKKRNEEKRQKELEIKRINKLRQQVWITNGKNNKKMYLDEIDQIETGWHRGFTHYLSAESLQNIIEAAHKSKGKTNITVDGKKTKIFTKDLDQFIKEHPNTQIGWDCLKINNKNCGSKGYKWLTKNNERKYVSPQKIDEFLQNGWELSSKNDNK